MNLKLCEMNPSEHKKYYCKIYPVLEPSFWGVTWAFPFVSRLLYFYSLKLLDKCFHMGTSGTLCVGLVLPEFLMNSVETTDL